MSEPSQQLRAMHVSHGSGPENKACGDCSACVDQRRSHLSRGSVACYVCRKAPTRMTAHGDIKLSRWQKSWPACGLFQEQQ